MSDLVPLTGEPLALDLVNTRPTGVDLLTTPEDLRAWLRLEADRFAQAREFAAVELTDAELAAVRDIRHRTARVLDHARHGTQPPAGDLAALNQAQRTAPAITELTWSGDVVTATHSRTGPAERGWRPGSPRPLPNCSPTRPSARSANARPATA
ncbi:hypothetical protein Pflav_046950 [Phytohabitans flavus]|uniref:Uncharacterized protein n=1 Tax=Phytohabitans flavus TaxID=1076124 RepID=A0A6F8XWS9_9ACTN|nr:ABATE domain-containing protein [Phytohabitans flavus]BCB78285.1 hypothetical protein Pflav_046950 [Phytohabitans flavus]